MSYALNTCTNVARAEGGNPLPLRSCSSMKASTSFALASTLSLTSTQRASRFLRL